VAVHGVVPAHTSFEIVQIFRWYNGETDSYWLASAVIRDGQFAGKRILLPWGGFPGPYEERPWMADTACIADSLNVALTREGRYAATAMIDMVEVAQRTLDEADADTRQQLEQERAQVPAENQPHRLITDSDYAAKMQLVMQAEQDAKRNQKGLWSDEGLKGRSPPKDRYLIQSAANPAVQGRVKSADGKAVLVSGFSAVSVVAGCTGE